MNNISGKTKPKPTFKVSDQSVDKSISSIHYQSSCCMATNWTGKPCLSSMQNLIIFALFKISEIERN